MHLVFFLWWKIKNWPGKNTLKQDSATSLFVAEDDLSIIFPDEETSPRKDLAKKIATNIIHINTEQAFALAITGEWGSGKTTFIKHIKDELEENDRAIIIPFSPWKNKGEEAVIADFFYSLKKSLSPYNEQLAPEISNYLNSLLNISTAIPAAGVPKVGKLGLQALKLLTPNIEGTEESYQKLAKAIDSIEEPIVVVIDDLDRLDAGEVVAVLKLIRNVANFKGITFIVAYSKAYVEKAIKKALSDHNSKYFLEKIVQKEVVLPKLDYNNLFQVLKNLLKNSKEESLREVIEAEENKDWLNADSKILWHYLETPRDIVRFYNSIILDFIEMGEYIHSKDFFYLYLIRLKYYEVYEMLWKKQKYIFTTNTNTNTLHIEKDKEKIISILHLRNRSTLPIIKTLFNVQTFEVTDDYDLIEESSPTEEEPEVSTRKRIYHVDNFSLLYQIFVPDISRITETVFLYISGTENNFINDLASISEEKKIILRKKLSTNLKSDVIHSIQSKESLSRCLHIYFTIEVNPDLIHATLYNNELQQRVIDSTDETDFLSVLRQILDGEEFKNNENVVRLLGAVSLNDYKIKLLDQDLFEYGYMQFEGFIKKIEQGDQLDARNTKILFFCLGELFRIQSIDKKLIMSNATKLRIKQVLIKFFDPLWIGNFLHPHINPFVLKGTFFYYLSLLLFPDDIEDFTKFITACSSKLNNNQHKALEEFLDAYKSQVHRTEIKQEPPVMHPNWGRYFVADLKYAPVIYGEAENITDFIANVNAYNSGIQKLYLKHAKELFQIRRKVEIEINQSKMASTHKLYIAVPYGTKIDDLEMDDTAITTGDVLEIYSTAKIDIDDIDLQKGNHLKFKYNIYEYNSAGFYLIKVF
ncbi:P-loop NTPase fold protein [Saprospira sp. CCB-QB6]|uniref:KAP family P-loop NTPase fold protein n=1 Tax=Saprospira sp. CCB-QB6 TaxID=3023936 RepID=UPI00234A4588|nr:P-loop NTPase fold protein [Saprospira sp. CCB-QB6]WCL80963.1 P-loop NTPase fold protein [Saprospira sp. CCB-QB6]